MPTFSKTLIRNKEDKILCLNRTSTHPDYPHHLDLPGGKVEKGESFIDAAIREIKEETSLVIPRDSMRLVYTKHSAVPQTNLIYACKIDSLEPDINLSWEHESYKWLTLDELISTPLPEKIDDYFNTVLEYLKTIV